MVCHRCCGIPRFCGSGIAVVEKRRIPASGFGWIIRFLLAHCLKKVGEFWWHSARHVATSEYTILPVIMATLGYPYVHKKGSGALTLNSTLTNAHWLNWPTSFNWVYHSLPSVYLGLILGVISRGKSRYVRKLWSSQNPSAVQIFGMDFHHGRTPGIPAFFLRYVGQYGNTVICDVGIYGSNKGQAIHAEKMSGLRIKPTGIHQ